MSRAENRHHRQRVIKKRIKELKITWPNSCTSAGPEWVLKQARQKDNPFTRCSCEMCTNKMLQRSENKRERKLAKQSIKKEENEQTAIESQYDHEQCCSDCNGHDIDNWYNYLDEKD